LSYDVKQSESGGGVEATERSRAPGKTTLTQRLPAIQRQVPSGGDAAGDDDAAHAYDAPDEHAYDTPAEDPGDAATHDAFNVASGATGPLPQLEQVQAAFGHHDLSGVRARSDAAAQASSDAIDARAYTAGSNIVFGTPSPDLHLIAHEAAHVVQQQAGVQLKGNVGEVGDRYEQHADAVADLVVQGKSAQSLLDTMAGGSPSSSPAPAPTGPIQRKESTQHLNAKKLRAGQQVAGLATGIHKSVTDGLAAELAALVTREQSAALGTKAKAAAEGVLAGGTDAEKDAKSEVDKFLSGAVAEQIKSKTTTVASTITNPLKGEVEAAARAAIGAAQPGKVFNTKTADLVSKAKTAANAKAAEKTAERLTTGKADVRKPAFLADLTTDVETSGRGRAGVELGKRNNLPGAVLSLIDAPVTSAVASVHAAVQSYLEEHIGANGTKLIGHKDANAFRKRMKTSAREQAYTDIDKIGGGLAPTKTLTHGTPSQGAQDRLTNAGQAKREYWVMQGKAQAYDDAKAPVSSYLLSLAHDGTNQILKTAGTQVAVHDQASAALWDVYRDKPEGTFAAKAATKAATAEATKQTTDLLKPATGAAFQWQDKLLKNQSVDTLEDGAQQSENLAQGGTSAKTLLNKEVEDQHVGSKSLETAIEAPTVGDGLGIIGHLIDLAVPNSGEALKLGVELKIPVVQVPGMFAVLKVEGNAERHQGKDLELTIGFEFGAGWETWGLSLDARLFLFMRSRGADTDKALKMMSYGVYRDMCSNPIVPEAMANFWATGAASKKGIVSKVEDAETWAAMIEEYAMDNDDAFVESGWGGAAQGKLKAGSLEAQAKLSGQTMRHWDKQSLGTDLGKLDHTGNKQERARKAMQKRKGVSGGERRYQWNLEAQAEVDIPGVPFKLGGLLKLQHMIRKGGGFAIDFELGGQLPYDPNNPSSSTLVSKIGASYAPAALTAIRQIYDRACTAHKDDEQQGVKGTGTGIDLAGEAFGVVDTTGVTGGLVKQLGDLHTLGGKSDYTNDTIANHLGTQTEGGLPSMFQSKSVLQLSFFGKDLGTQQWQLGATLAEIKKMDVGVGNRLGGGVGATFSGEKTKKLFTVSGGGAPGGVNNW
jgi:hypothetical protein